jgi:predicted unusual protein kinase regulating ubiquinone biosynthesis (AarF/ABC1/UbiB family)
MFDRFSLKASNAASIGQVHEAWKDGKRLAVKVQYPGVAESITSDLKMVRPFAVRLMGLNEADVNRYTQEVEARLLEETDYTLEMERSIFISEACSHIPGLIFPKYHPEFSCSRILTMDWLPGLHLKEFLETNPSQEVRDAIGQSLWDFYEYQIHSLRQVHADPHPGNFLLQKDGTLGIIDFGCVKEIPDTYYNSYFALINPANIADEARILKLFFALEFLYPQDSEKEKAFYIPLFTQMIRMLGRPFQADTFDFGDDAYFEGIYDFAKELSSMKELRESKVARGSKDGLYINRTYFGLYSLLNQLKARVQTHSVFKSIVLQD